MDNRKELYFYSLYTDADGGEVCIFETKDDAIKAKKEWSDAWLVMGPFEHIRPELELVFAAKRASHFLRKLQFLDSNYIKLEAEQLADAIDHGIRRAFPFQRVLTLDGASINLDSKTQAVPR